jgi:drug/metabolite transporter (DMT)-like permease
MILLTTTLETGQVDKATEAGWAFVAALLFSALVVSLLAHTIYYGLIGKYPANLIAPLTIMNPLFTVVLGILVTGDQFDGRMALGTSLALCGVLIIAFRRNHVMPLASVLWGRFR